MRPALVLLCVTLHAAPAVFGQSPASPPAAPASSGVQTPTFRSGVRLVEVDVFVTAREGNAVRDLAVDDFRLVLCAVSASALKAARRRIALQVARPPLL